MDPKLQVATYACTPAPSGARLSPTLPPTLSGERSSTVEILADVIPEGPVWLAIEPSISVGRPTLLRLSPGEEVVLGSGSSLGLPIEDITVSGRHCSLRYVKEGLEVVDLGSRNGVRVGGVRVPRAILPVGAAFEIGRTLVRIQPGERDTTVNAPLLPGLVGGSLAMQRLAASARRIASLRLPALLRGESGSGKDLVARAIHETSDRRDKPFVAINAATISRDLAESELFGHRRGAFTGAVRDRRGAFREANGGTLFLDEIGSVPFDVQAKLLRVVEEGVVRPLGSECGQAVDVRLIAATCEPLEMMVSESRFRADLYERLAVCVVQVPPLRERLDDIPALATHLLTASDLGGRELSMGAFAVLRSHRWPGNVRELRNVVVQAAIRAGGRVLSGHVAEVLAERASVKPKRLQPLDARRIYEEVGRNISEAARRAEVPRTTMRNLLRAAGLAVR